MEPQDWIFSSAIGAMVILYMVWQCCVWRRWIIQEVEEMHTAPAVVNVVVVGGGGGGGTSWSHDVANKALDREVLASLPVFVYSSSDEEMKRLDACAVCLGEFEDGEKGRRLRPCSHCFHVQCIDKWFSSHSTCPICRSLVGFLDV